MAGAGVKVGIVGASGYTGAELLRLAAQHPDFEVVVATGDSMAGRRAADLYPSLEVAYPDAGVLRVRPRGRPRSRPGVPRAAPRGLDGARSVAGRHRRLRRRPVRSVPAQGRRRLPDLLRVRAHAARPAGAGGVRTARTPPRRARGGTARRHAGMPRHRSDVGAAAARGRRSGRVHRHRGQHAHRDHRRRSRPDRHERVHEHRFERDSVRPDLASAHAGDGAGDRRAG